MNPTIEKLIEELCISSHQEIFEQSFERKKGTPIFYIAIEYNQKRSYLPKENYKSFLKQIESRKKEIEIFQITYFEDLNKEEEHPMRFCSFWTMIEGHPPKERELNPVY
jgi:hypothetical protein